MPFKSKSQRRAMWAKAEEGEISKDTVREWERKTDDENLPEKVDNKKESSALSIEDAYRINPEVAKRLFGLTDLPSPATMKSLDVPLSGKEKALIGGTAAAGGLGGTGIGLYQYNKAQERMEKESSLKISHNLGKLEALQKLGLE